MHTQSSEKNLRQQQQHDKASSPTVQCIQSPSPKSIIKLNPVKKTPTADTVGVSNFAQGADNAVRSCSQQSQNRLSVLQVHSSQEKRRETNQLRAPQAKYWDRSSPTSTNSRRRKAAIKEQIH